MLWPGPAPSLPRCWVPQSVTPLMQAARPSVATWCAAAQQTSSAVHAPADASGAWSLGTRQWQFRRALSGGHSAHEGSPLLGRPDLYILPQTCAAPQFSLRMRVGGANAGTGLATPTTRRLSIDPSTQQDRARRHAPRRASGTIAAAEANSALLGLEWARSATIAAHPANHRLFCTSLFRLSSSARSSFKAAQGWRTLTRRQGSSCKARRLYSYEPWPQP